MPEVLTVSASLDSIARLTTDAAAMAEVAGLSDTATFGVGGSLERLLWDHGDMHTRLKTIDDMKSSDSVVEMEVLFGGR